jgi:hypothetical protein
VPAFKDRVKQISVVAPGTGSVTLPAGAATGGYQTFAAAFAVGTPFLYCIVDNTNNLWETGTGILTSSTNMTRDAYVMDGSSGNGVLVNFTAQPLDVFCTVTSHWCEDVDGGAALARARGYALP